MAQIRHMAIFTERPGELARYYADVFGLTVTGTGKRGDVWLTDGHLDIALIPRLDPSYPPAGLNHFGFTLEPGETAGVHARMRNYGIDPVKPPPDRPYVEEKGRDIDGNVFDLATARVAAAGDGTVRDKLPEPPGG